jgi:hypothetical protein
MINIKWYEQKNIKAKKKANIKKFFNEWPFKTWQQGYILGLINGFILGTVIIFIFVFLW